MTSHNYNYIFHPKNNNLVMVNSKEGKSIINNYITHLKGGDGRLAPVNAQARAFAAAPLRPPARSDTVTTVPTAHTANVPSGRTIGPQEHALKMAPLRPRTRSDTAPTVHTSNVPSGRTIDPQEHAWNIAPMRSQAQSRAIGRTGRATRRPSSDVGAADLERWKEALLSEIAHTQKDQRDELKEMQAATDLLREEQIQMIALLTKPPTTRSFCSIS